MGTDFLNRMKKSFHRALDRGEIALRTPTLLMPKIGGVSRTARALIRKNAKVAQGERLFLRLIEGRMVGQRDAEIILDFEDPPTECIDHLNKSGGIELGEVTVVHPISEAVEVVFCDEQPTE